MNAYSHLYIVSNLHDGILRDWIIEAIRINSKNLRNSIMASVTPTTNSADIADYFITHILHSKTLFFPPTALIIFSI